MFLTWDGSTFDFGPKKPKTFLGKQVVEMAAMYRRMAYEQHITKQINHPAHKVLSTLSNREVRVA
jgi:hypothetical protein